MLARILTSEHQNSGSLEKASLRNDAVKKKKKKVPSEKKKNQQIFEFLSTHGAFSHGSAVGTAPFSCRRCFFLRKHPRQPCRCFQWLWRCEGHDLQGNRTGDSRKSNPRVLPSLLAPAKPPLVPNPGSQTQAGVWGQPLQTPPHCGPSPLFPHE